MKKLFAMFCALGMMATLAACGEQDGVSSEAATTEVTTEATTEITTETTIETTTEATTETTAETTTETDTITEEEETTDLESEEESVDADALTAELTQTEITDSFSLSVSPNWTKDESLGYPMWYMEDASGAFFVQEFDTADMGISADTDHTTVLEQIGAAMSSQEQAVVVAEEWDTINGEEAYGVTYTLETSGITTTNVSIFFYVGETVCGITFTDFGGTGTVMDYAMPVLDSITF